MSEMVPMVRHRNGRIGIFWYRSWVAKVNALLTHFSMLDGCDEE